jgi:hypothetical protein
LVSGRLKFPSNEAGEFDAPRRVGVDAQTVGVEEHAIPFDTGHEAVEDLAQLAENVLVGREQGVGMRTRHEGAVGPVGSIDISFSDDSQAGSFRARDQDGAGRCDDQQPAIESRHGLDE